VLERLPFRVEVIQTDNGVEFGSGFHWHVLDKGVGHVYIKPRTPRLNGKVERSHASTPRRSTASWTAS
jgi:transposase InsO family protein